MIALLAASLIIESNLCYYPNESELKALAWVETRNNPRAKGKHFEVSEYQILPWVWNRFTSSKFHPMDASLSKLVASRIFAHNWEQFEKANPPHKTREEDMYVLWCYGWPKYHAIGWKFSRVPKSIQKKAKQYAAKVKEF